MHEDFHSLLGQLREAGQVVNSQVDALSITAAFFDSNPIPAWIKTVNNDNTFSIMAVNRAYEQITGIPSASFANLNDADFQTPQVAQELARTDLEALNSGDPQRVDVIIRHRVTGIPVRLIGWKWRVPSEGSAVAICGFGQEFPVQ